MKQIMVGFSKPKTWKIFAALIMWGYGIPYDHVYIKYYSDEFDQWMIFQASKTAVNLVSETTFLADNIAVKEFTVPLADNQMDAMLSFAADNLSKPYGIKECFGLAYVRLMSLFGKTVSNPFKFTGSTYVCSELAGYVCDNFAGMNVDKDPADINPKELYDYLTAKFLPTQQ